MSKIEDVMYEAYEMDISERVFLKIKELKINEQYKYTSLSDIYELAFNHVKKEYLGKK